MDTFISDSASDNYGTYNVLQHWGVNAVIALNSTNEGNAKYPPSLKIDDNGTPICCAGYTMVYSGFSKDRCRIKWRCPRVSGKVDYCPACTGCSNSSYGRVVHTKPSWDPRLFTNIPRGSRLWKSKMNERTASERINDRIMQDYHLENTKIRSQKRIFFYITAAAMNIHLDTQLRFMTEHGMFDFCKLLGLDLRLAA